MYPEDVNGKTMEDRTNHGDGKRVMAIYGETISVRRD